VLSVNFKGMELPVQAPFLERADYQDPLEQTEMRISGGVFLKAESETKTLCPSLS